MGGLPTNSGYTEVPQQPAQEVVVQAPAEIITTSTPTAEEQHLIKRARSSLILVCFAQMFAGFYCLLFGGFLFAIVTLLFVSMGMSGARKMRADHLSLHFGFTFIVYILSLIGLISGFIYGEDLPLSLVLAMFAWIFIQILGLKSSRILIDMSRKYKDAGLPVAVANQKCCGKTACTSVPQQPQIPPSYNDFVAHQSNVTFVPMQPAAVDANNANPSLTVPQYAPYMYMQPAEGYIYVPAPAEIDVEHVNNSAAYPGQFKTTN
jgi:hypothetical protein